MAEKGTASSFRALAEVIAKHGLFCELCTDRGIHYFQTPKARERVSKSVQAQVGRALAQLGIRHIAAYSPEAHGPLRARLPHLATPAAEGAGAGRHHDDRGGQPLARQTYWPAHNAAFAVAPVETGSAFVPDRSGRVRDILCIQEERRIDTDNTVKWRALTLQIPPSPLRPHFVRATVRVHEYPGGHLAIFHVPHRLADYYPRESHATGCVSRYGNPQAQPQKGSINALRRPVNLTRQPQ